MINPLSNIRKIVTFGTCPCLSPNLVEESSYMFATPQFLNNDSFLRESFDIPGGVDEVIHEN